MSLKAKLEAVIYAAEEPVTLAQLAGLFAADAFAWKAEREAETTLRFESGPDAGGESGTSDSSRELSDLSELSDLVGQSGLAEVVDGGAEAASADTAVTPEPGPESGSEPGTVPADDKVLDHEDVDHKDLELEAMELEARRLQRLREREVREILRGVLDELIAEYAQDSRGIEIREIAGGFRMGTKPEIHDAVRAFIKSLKPPMKLSLPALETLAVIAYKQPVTAPEVGEVRGVDSAGVLGSLLSRKLIATAGRKQVIGRPILYKTTREFLLRFGLKDLNELPSMEEFEKMAALELSEESVDEDPTEQSGDLFAEPEQNSKATFEENEPEEPIRTSEEEVVVSIPTAETSKEAAEAHAPVERPDAEVVEVEQ
jgi:segregation and condensation protein B